MRISDWSSDVCSSDLAQIAFARVVTDHATFAHLADVYVLEKHQSQGLASAMLRYFHDHPDLQRLRRWTLNTLDAHSLYERHGWERIPGPRREERRVGKEGVSRCSTCGSPIDKKKKKK